MNPNQLGKSDAQRPPLPTVRAPGTAPLKPPGPKLPEAPPAPPPPPAPTARLTRDGDATSNFAKARAEQAASAYSNLLLKADVQTKTWDDAFGKFTARASQEDATRKFQERESSKKAVEQGTQHAGGADQLSSTGKVILSKVKKAEKEEEVDESGEVGEAEPDIFTSDANGTMEREKINQLPKERQASYEQCAKHMKNDPEARLAMQSLLLEGKIPGTLSDQDNNDLLANLDAFATMELDPEIDRWALIADVLADLGRPSAIVSGEGPTDPVMNVLIMLAASHPAEYVRLIRLLASPEGVARLANGKKVKRNGRQRTGHGRWSARLLWECLDEAWDADDDDEDDEGQGGGGQQGQQQQGQQQQGQQQGQPPARPGQPPRPGQPQGVQIPRPTSFLQQRQQPS